MRFMKPLFAICALALAAGSAQAEGPQGVTGNDWDDSHMRTRHQPTYRQATRSATKPATLGKIAGKPGQARILPSAEYREWQSGPVASSTASRRSSKSTIGHSLTERGKRSSRRATSGRGSSTRSRSSTR